MKQKLREPSESCRMTRLQLIRGLCALALGFFLLGSHGTSIAAEFDQSHARFSGILTRYVKGTGVDYAGLKAHPQELNSYLEEIAAVKKADFKKWGEPEQIAFLINTYNASTLRLIMDHHPLKSIRDIGALPGAAWREMIVRFWDELMTLDHLENKILRVEYREPRIHFALVCAAKGCPPLRTEAYVGLRLGEQLDDQARIFLGTPDKNRFDATKNTLHLSPIFKWYEKDFTQAAGSLTAYVKPFLPESQRAALEGRKKIKIRFTDYDWTLNELEK